MPMDTGMLWGMALIIGGAVAAAYGLQPKEASARALTAHQRIVAPEDAPLTVWHWVAGGALAMALVIDIMKPASLGFVTPGMKVEYMIGPAKVALLPFAALAGTALGSFVWGVLADLYGRRATILLSAVMFIGTSICGAMPSFWWNVFMCFLMGAVGGRHAACCIRAAGRDHADAPPRLDAGAGRRHRRRGRLSGRLRRVGAAAADLRLADHVVSEPSLRD